MVIPKALFYLLSIAFAVWVFFVIFFLAGDYEYHLGWQYFCEEYCSGLSWDSAKSTKCFFRMVILILSIHKAERPFHSLVLFSVFPLQGFKVSIVGVF